MYHNIWNIESFHFSGYCGRGREVFQPVWDTLLTTRVRELLMFFPFSESNNVNGGNNLDFSNISTNTSLKELTVVATTLCGTNLFDSIKGNTTLEKLIVRPPRSCEANLNDSGKKALIEMLFENTTLIQVELKDGHSNQILQEEIDIPLKLNRMWKRLIIVKDKERMAAATAAATALCTTTNVTATNDDDDATVERKREQDNNVDEVENN